MENDEKIFLEKEKNDRMRKESATFADSIYQWRVDPNFPNKTEVAETCRKQFEIIFSEKDPELAFELMLSFVHSMLPFSEMAKSTGVSAESNASEEDKSRRRLLNYFSMLIGDTETIRRWADEFIASEPDEDNKILPQNKIVDFLPPLKKENDLKASENLISEMGDDSTLKEKYLQSGYTQDELNRAKELFLEPSGYKIIREVAGRFNLGSADLIRKWSKSEFPHSVIPNLSAIKDLEKISPGSSEHLFSGPEQIRFFGRYDTEFLAEQMTPLQSGEPYGVMCSAYEDHNGAFSNKKGIHKQLREEASRLGMKTRIMEYSSDESPRDRLLNGLSHIAPPISGQPFPLADFIWINQHGLTHQFDPGKIEEKRKDWEHVFGIGQNRSSLVVKPGGAVGSFMCWGGEEDNVMDQLAKEYNLSATGATKPPSNIYGIRFNREKSGSLHIDVDYGYTSARPGQTNIYNYEE